MKIQQQNIREYDVKQRVALRECRVMSLAGVQVLILRPYTNARHFASTLSEINIYSIISTTYSLTDTTSKDKHIRSADSRPH